MNSKFVQSYTCIINHNQQSIIIKILVFYIYCKDQHKCRAPISKTNILNYVGNINCNIKILSKKTQFQIRIKKGKLTYQYKILSFSRPSKTKNTVLNSEPKLLRT